MDGYSAAQIRAAEEPLLARGVPLMARAAHALAEAVASMAATRGAVGPVVVLVGSGNNGGDALFAAAELALAGTAVSVLPVSDRVHQEGLAAAVRAGAVIAADPVVSEEAAADAFVRMARQTHIVIDGILGTGSAGRATLLGKARAVIRAAVQCQQAGANFSVVAVDVPSGLDPDSGTAEPGFVLPADMTVTFGACKAGLLRGQGTEVAGHIEVVDIGLLPQLEGQQPIVTSID